MAPRSTLIQPASGSASGSGVAGALEGLGYTFEKQASKIQERQDVSYQQDIFNDITETSQNIYINNKENPQAFEEVYKSYQDKMLASVPSRLQGRIRQELDSQRLRRGEQVSVNFQKKEQLNKDATSYKFNINASNEVLNEFRSGNVKHANQLIDELSLANLDSGSFTPEQVERIRNGLFEQGLGQRVKGEAERAYSSDGLRGLVGYKDDIEQSKDLFQNPDQKDSALNHVNNLIGREEARIKQIQAQQKARLSATKKNVAGKVNSLVDVMELGYDIDQEVLNEFDSAVTTLDMPESRSKMDSAFRGQQFARLPPAERQQLLNSLIERAPQEYSFYKNIDSKVAGLEKEDPLLHYSRQGKVEIQGIDLNDPQSIQSRADSVNELTELTGIKSPLLTKQEQTAIIKTFNTLPADQKTSLVGNLVAGLGDDAAITLNDIAKKNGPSMALAGQLFMDGAPAVAESIFMGQDVMLNMKEIMPKSADFALEVDTALGAAYSDNPLQRKTVVEAAKAVYADMARTEGDLSGIMDSDRMQTALDQVTGGLIDYESGSWSISGQSSRIEPPQRGMTTDQFSDWIDDISVDDIENMGGSNMSSKAVIKLLKDDAQLVSVRVEGKRHPVYIIKTDAGAIANKDGTAPFYLEYTRK